MVTTYLPIQKKKKDVLRDFAKVLHTVACMLVMTETAVCFVFNIVQDADQIFSPFLRKPATPQCYIL